MNDKIPKAHLPRSQDRQTDEQLVKATQAGDKRAFVEIVARYQVTVSAVTLAILKDFGASEDVAQETFLIAWKKIQEIREPTKLRAWLAGIARLTAFKRLRDRRPEEPLDATILATPDRAQRPDEAMVSSEEMSLVHAALKSLPESYRLPLVLFYREDHSIRAVAEALNLSEGTAKKRLSRARKMLHDEMCGVVDSVLGRTLPTAAFTVAIAASIGALSTPTTLAAWTFANAGAVNTSTATTAVSAASLGTVTTMTTSKLTLAAATTMAAVCFSIGYQVHIATEPEIPKPQSLITAFPTGSTESPKDVIPDLPDSYLIAEWKRLHEEHGTGSEAMPRLHAEIMKIANGFNRRALLSALVVEWAEVSPETGWAFYGKQGKRDWQLNLFLDEYIKRDGWTAVEVVTSAGGPAWKKRLRRRLPELTERLLPKIGERDPTMFALLVDQLPRSRGDWDEDVRKAFVSLAAENFQYARAAAEKITGPNRQEALAGMAMVWAEHDGQAAYEWAQSALEGAERNQLVESVLVGWAQTNPAIALREVAKIPAVGSNSVMRSTTAAQKVLRAATEADFEATVTWLKNNPGKIGQRDLASLDTAILPRMMTDPGGFFSQAEANGSLEVLEHGITQTLLNDGSVVSEVIWEHLGELKGSKMVDRLRQSILNSLAYREPTAALQLLQDMPSDERSPALVELTFRGFFNGGDLLDRFDGLLEQTSPELRPDLLKVGFGYLKSENLVDPQAWGERFAELAPGQSREAAVKSLARAWTELDPLNSTVWLETLEGKDQEAGYRVAASQWVQADEIGASEWIEQLPQGRGRDASITGLVDGLARSDPEAAWEWAGGIEETELRLKTAGNVLKSLIAKNAEEARNLLEESAFSEIEKVEMFLLFE